MTYKHTNIQTYKHASIQTLWLLESLDLLDRETKNTYSRSANPFNLFFTKNPLNLFPQVCWDFLIVKDLMVKSLTPGEWVWYTAALLVDRKRTTVSAGFCRHLIHTGEMKKRIHQVHLKRTHLWGTLKWEFHLQDTQFAMLEQLANEKTNQH